MSQSQPTLPKHWQNILPLLNEAATNDALLLRLKYITQEDYEALLVEYSITDEDVLACRSDFALYFSVMEITDWYP